MKQIPGHPNYRITKCGVVYGPMRDAPLKPWLHRSGHVYVGLGASYKDQVHRLVLLTYKGPCPTGCEALHKDGNPANNMLRNLRWGTRADNIKDLIKHSGVSSAAKLTRTQADAIISDIKKLPRIGTSAVMRSPIYPRGSLGKIAKKHRVPAYTVYGIAHRKTYSIGR